MRVLVVSGEETTLSALMLMLRGGGYEVVGAAGPGNDTRIGSGEQPELVILHVPPGEAVPSVSGLRRGLGVPVMLIGEEDDSPEQDSRAVHEPAPQVQVLRVVQELAEACRGHKVSSATYPTFVAYGSKRLS